MIYILWLASMIVNNNTDTAPNKNIALFVIFVFPIAAASTIIILLGLSSSLSHQIDCIPLSNDVFLLNDLLFFLLSFRLNYRFYSSNTKLTLSHVSVSWCFFRSLFRFNYKRYSMDLSRKKRVRKSKWSKN